MAISKRNEGAKVSSDINVTPMVDVMLVLLIIFMVITPMLQHGKMWTWRKSTTQRPCRMRTKMTHYCLRSPATERSTLGNDEIQLDAHHDQSERPSASKSVQQNGVRES